MTSADSPLKGLPTLLRAVAKLVTDRDAHLVVVGKPDRHRAHDEAGKNRRTNSERGTRIRFTQRENPFCCGEEFAAHA